MSCFPSAIHLRCFLHFKGNIERKLYELKIPPNVAKEYIADIMGRPTRFQLGLVDAKNSAHLDEMLVKIQNVWNEREKPYNSPPIFHTWFLQYQKNIISQSMVQEVRIKAGLGNPPVPYYTNEVESKNYVLKQHVAYKASALPKFVDNMKDLFRQQRQEIERAMIGQGEYRLQTSYESYCIHTTKWFTLTQDQRSKRVDKFMKADILSHSSCSSSLESSSEACSPLQELSLPSHFASSMWNKAQRLCNSDDGMVQCPGDHSSWMVKSDSNTRPHFVRSGKCGGYMCDEDCLAYKSTKLCAHAVAVAIKTGTLEKYLKWYKTRKGSGANLSAIAEAQKPKSCGKKRKGISKKASKRIKSVVAEVDETVWQYPQCTNSGDDASDDGLPPDLSLSSHGPHFDSSPDRSTASSSPHLSTASSSGKQGSNVSVLTQDTINMQPLNAGTLQVNYSNVQIASGPPPLLRAPLSQCVTPPRKNYTIPPPELSQQHEQRPIIESPFWVAFVFGNVSRCNGCKGRIRRAPDNRPLPPPDNLVLGHKEYIVFSNPRTGRFEQSRDKRNVYYHPWKTCIIPNFVNFDPREHLVIADDVKSKLLPSHMELLSFEFGVLFS